MITKNVIGIVTTCHCVPANTADYLVLAVSHIYDVITTCAFV
ncbi:MAG: hypothetical protein PHH09_12810 [Methanoregulaceae archaeon]|nr:hypothetical protein [Methanoregulaceae archaeon]